MPVHDWMRVDAGTFHAVHAVHGAWITHLMEVLNGGLLPDGFYALAEQHAGRRIADVLALHGPEPSRPEASAGGAGGLALADAPPKVLRRLVAEPRAVYRLARRTLAIRHTSGHRVVALIEIVSPGNKDRQANVGEFVDKVSGALEFGCHVLMVDLWLPVAYDPGGMHGAIWDQYGSGSYDLPQGQPLTVASYLTNALPEAFIEHLAVGEPLPAMPLFLDAHTYVPLPLEATYTQAYEGLPRYWRGVIQDVATPDAGYNPSIVNDRLKLTHPAGRT